MLVILNLPLIGIWIKLLTVPYRILYPSILVFMAIGVYSLSNSPFDVLLMALFGILGVHFRQARVRAGAADPRLRSRADDGGEPAARAAAVARRPDGLVHQADQRRVPHRRDHPARHRPGADHPQEARGGLRGRLNGGWAGKGETPRGGQLPLDRATALLYIELTALSS